MSNKKYPPSKKDHVTWATVVASSPTTSETAFSTPDSKHEPRIRPHVGPGVNRSIAELCQVSHYLNLCGFFAQVECTLGGYTAVARFGNINSGNLTYLLYQWCEQSHRISRNQGPWCIFPCYYVHKYFTCIYVFTTAIGIAPKESLNFRKSPYG